MLDIDIVNMEVLQLLLPRAAVASLPTRHASVVRASKRVSPEKAVPQNETQFLALKKEPMQDSSQ